MSAALRPTANALCCLGRRIAVLGAAAVVAPPVLDGLYDQGIFLQVLWSGLQAPFLKARLSSSHNVIHAEKLPPWVSPPRPSTSRDPAARSAAGGGVWHLGPSPGQWG